MRLHIRRRLRNPVLVTRSKEASMLRKLTTAVAAAVTLAAVSSPAGAIETIDCAARPLNAAEQTICASQRLQILDAKITEVYADLMYGRRLSEAAKQTLRASQHAFLARRDSCGRSFDCLEEMMSLRASRMQNYW
jgi:uncharacterized protein